MAGSILGFTLVRQYTGFLSEVLYKPAHLICKFRMLRGSVITIGHCSQRKIGATVHFCYLAFFCPEEKCRCFKCLLIKQGKEYRFAFCRMCLACFRCFPFYFSRNTVFVQVYVDNYFG